MRLGEHDLRTDDGGHQDIPIARTVTHEEFDPNIKTNDIAIIHLERDVEFSGKIFIFLFFNPKRLEIFSLFLHSTIP